MTGFLDLEKDSLSSRFHHEESAVLGRVVRAEPPAWWWDFSDEVQALGQAREQEGKRTSGVASG